MTPWLSAVAFWNVNFVKMDSGGVFLWALTPLWFVVWFLDKRQKIRYVENTGLGDFIRFVL